MDIFNSPYSTSSAVSVSSSFVRFPDKLKDLMNSKRSERIMNSEGMTLICLFLFTQWNERKLAQIL